MIHEEIVTYEVCKLAKEKGFDEECREFYCDDKSQKRITRISCNRHVTSFDYCSNSMLEDYYPPHEYCYIAAPTQSLLKRWLREEKGVVFGISPMQEMDCEELGWCATIYKVDENGYGLSWKEELYYNTFELVLENALKYALEYLL